MTYQELINNIMSLGYSDTEEMEEFAESGVLYDSINRAITRINLEVAPILAKYEFDITDEDTGYMYLDFTDIDELFLEFADNPVLIAKNGTDFYTKFADFEIETDNTLVINADENQGSFRAFYKVRHETFAGAAAELREELPLQLKVHHLVPLLAAYYVWLDDEPTKAAQYYNMYDQEKIELRERAQNNKIKMRVLSGGM